MERENGGLLGAETWEQEESRRTGEAEGELGGGCWASAFGICICFPHVAVGLLWVRSSPWHLRISQGHLLDVHESLRRVRKLREGISDLSK